jgi:hypothetical protein
VTPPEPDARPTGGGKLGDYAGRKGALPTWPRVAALLVLFGFTFFVVKGCQDDQVRLTQQDAIALAEDQVDFEPGNTQIRLLRQGLDRRPIWVVSLSIAKGAEGPDPDFFKRLALVRIDANKGTVESVEEQETPGAPGLAEGGDADQAQP